MVTRTELRNAVITIVCMFTTIVILSLVVLLLVKPAQAQYQGIYGGQGGYTVQPTIPGTSSPSFNAPGYVVQPQYAPSPYSRGSIYNNIPRMLNPC